LTGIANGGGAAPKTKGGGGPFHPTTLEHPLFHPGSPTSKRSTKQATANVAEYGCGTLGGGATGAGALVLLPRGTLYGKRCPAARATQYPPLNTTAGAVHEAPIVTGPNESVASSWPGSRSAIRPHGAGSRTPGCSLPPGFPACPAPPPVAPDVLPKRVQSAECIQKCTQPLRRSREPTHCYADRGMGSNLEIDRRVPMRGQRLPPGMRCFSGEHFAG